MMTFQTIKRGLALSAAAALLLLLLIYLVDCGLARYRARRNRDAFGVVRVRRYYAIAEKNGKTEFLFNPPEDQTCIHSLFPQLGFAPCWYLSRHPEQRIEI